MNDADGFRLEAAEQFGFEEIDGQDPPGQEGYFCTEAELIAFAKACERKGLAEAKIIATDIEKNRPVGHFIPDFQGGFKHGAFVVANRLNDKIIAIDAELAPILETERQRALAPHELIPTACANCQNTGWCHAFDKCELTGKPLVRQ